MQREEGREGGRGTFSRGPLSSMRGGLAKFRLLSPHFAHRIWTFGLQVLGVFGLGSRNGMLSNASNSPVVIDT